MNKKINKLSEDDRTAFRTAMRGVKKLIQRNKAPLSPTLPKKTNISSLSSIDTETTNPLSDFDSLSLVSSEELLFFSRPGIQDKTLRNLRNGKYNVEATLDLHGMTVNQAREALYHFLLRCQQKNIQYVLVIHGKGRSSSSPILKNKVNHWLRQTEHVLAFCSANIRDGLSGSLYVLLKVKRRR